MIVGIFHSADLDGVCCAALFKIKYPEGVLIPYDYGGHTFDIDRIPNGSTVLMMDVSLPDDQMIKLASRTVLTLIDHHEEKIKSLTGRREVINEVVRVGGASIYCVADPARAACEILFDFLKLNESVSIGGAMTVHLLALYDIWAKHDLKAWNKQIKPFQFGLRGRIGLDVDKLIKLLKESSLLVCDMITEDGKMILRYQDEQDRITIRDLAFECEMRVLGKSYKAVAINARNISSDSFDSVDLRHTIIVMYWYQNGKWKVSMRSDGAANLAQLCSVFQGGGHYNAAGCVFDHITFSTSLERKITLRNGYKSPRLELI